MDLVKTYIARIEEVNEEFSAVLEINSDAVSIAKELDDERNRSGRRGWGRNPKVLHIVA